MKATRFQCVVCGKITAGRQPRRGDTSARFPRQHKGPDGELCPGCFQEAVWVDVEPHPAPRYEERQHQRSPGRSAMGRTTEWITCPFCGAQVEAYVWSLAGGGKKCPGCGALHGWMHQVSLRRVLAENHKE